MIVTEKKGIEHGVIKNFLLEKSRVVFQVNYI